MSVVFIPATTNYTVRHLDASGREVRSAGRGADPCTGCPIVLRVSPAMDKAAQHAVKRDAAHLFPGKPILLLDEVVCTVAVRDNDPAHFGRVTTYAVSDLIAKPDFLRGVGDWAMQPFRVLRTFHNPWRGDVELITMLERVPFFYPLEGDTPPKDGERPAYVRRMTEAAFASWGEPLLGRRVFAGANLRLAQVRRVGSTMLLSDELPTPAPKPPRQTRVAAKGRRR